MGSDTSETAKMVKWRVPDAGISTPGTAKMMKWRVPGMGSGTSETIGFLKWLTTRETFKSSRKSQ